MRSQDFELHIIVGTQDTFHLEAGLYVLRDMLMRLGAVISTVSKSGSSGSASNETP